MSTLSGFGAAGAALGTVGATVCDGALTGSSATRTPMAESAKRRMPCTGLPPSSYAKRILPPAVLLRPPLHFGKLRHSPAELFGRTELRHQVSPQQVQREWLADDLRSEAQHVHVVVLDALVR